jgi:hypothetical protein
MPRLLPIVILFALSTACAGPAHTGDGSPGASDVALTAARISLRDYRTGTYFALARGSEEERLALYSEKRENAATKVPDADFFQGLLDLFEKDGLAKVAQNGPAPAVDEQGTKALEIREGDRIRHVVRRPGMSDNERKAFDEYVLGFSEVYNHTYALQSVDSQNQEFHFEPVKSASDKGSKN